MKEIKSTELQAWIAEEIGNASNPEQVVVNFCVPLVLGGRRVEGSKTFAPDAATIATAINEHGNETLKVGNTRTYTTEGDWRWTLSLDVYLERCNYRLL